MAEGTSRRAGRNLVAVLTGELLGKAATLAFTIIVARALGVEGFGSLSYALAFGLLLGTFIAWGFDTEVARRGSQDRQSLNEVLGRALVLRTIHAIPVVLVGALVGASTRPDAAAVQSFLLVVLATLLDSYGDSGRAAATACEQSGRAAIALVTQRVTACLLAVLVLAAGGHLVAVSGVYLLSSAMGQTVLAYQLHRFGVRPCFRGMDAEALKEMWRSTFLLGLDTVLAMALFRIDSLMLGALAGDAELANYSVGYRLMETVLFVTWAVARPLVPTMVRASPGRGALRVGENALAVSAVLLVPYGVFLLLEGGELLHLLFGPAYGPESLAALRFLAFAPVCFALSYYCGYLLFVQGHKVQLVLATLLATIVNVALNFVVIPVYGAVGAALVTTLSYLLEGFISMLFLARSTGILRVDRALLLGVGASLPLAGMLMILDAPVLLEAIASGSVYLLAYLGLARWLAPGQITLLRSLVRRT